MPKRKTNKQVRGGMTLNAAIKNLGHVLKRAATPFAPRSPLEIFRKRGSGMYIDSSDGRAALSNLKAFTRAGMRGRGIGFSVFLLAAR